MLHESMKDEMSYHSEKIGTFAQEIKGCHKVNDEAIRVLETSFCLTKSLMISSKVGYNFQVWSAGEMLQ